VTATRRAATNADPGVVDPAFHHVEPPPTVRYFCS
jgi:hypothetical protein